jgi:phospholipid-binding lipoprotein MlaA
MSLLLGRETAPPGSNGSETRVAAKDDKVRKLGLALALGAVLAAGTAQAQTGSQASGAEADPWQSFNRGVYSFNQGLDAIVLAPAAHLWMAVVPKLARQGVHNILENLAEPSTFVNRVVQLKIGKAGKSAVRFATNSTIGLAGTFDMARRGGLPRDATDFGQTLAQYGVGSGPYFYVPILGPSTVRDAFGEVVDIVTNPIGQTQITRYRPNLYLYLGLLTVDTRAEVDPLLRDVQANATDPYATLRSLYLQNRRSVVNGGELDVQDLPDYGAPVIEPAPLPAPAPVAKTEPVADPALRGERPPAWASATTADHDRDL